MAKIRKNVEERQLASNENDVSTSGQHCLAASDDSTRECNRGQAETMEEEKPAKADEIMFLMADSFSLLF
jgi:hypothetical protein